MTIEKFSSESHNKYITVTFNYEEVRDLANGLYHLTEQVDKEEYKKFNDMSAKTHLLFDLVKHGNIQETTVKKFSRLLKGSLLGGDK